MPVVECPARDAKVELDEQNHPQSQGETEPITDLTFVVRSSLLDGRRRALQRSRREGGAERRDHLADTQLRPEFGTCAALLAVLTNQAIRTH